MGSRSTLLSPHAVVQRPCGQLGHEIFQLTHGEGLVLASSFELMAPLPEIREDVVQDIEPTPIWDADQVAST